MAPKTAFRFGKNARIEIARYTNGNEPAQTDFVRFCLTNTVTVGTEKGSITIENWCLGGSADIPDGSSKGNLSFGDAQWTEDDLAIAMLEDAAFADSEEGGKVHYRIYPLGKTKGNPVFRGILNVFKWDMEAALKGVLTAKHDVRPEGRPERGVLTDDNGGFQAVESRYDAVAAATTPAPINGGNLTDLQATNLQTMTANQVTNYSVTSTGTGDIAATTANTSQPVTVAILNSAGQTVATGTNTATAPAQPAGTYTVRVSSTTGSTGGTITVDYLA